MGLIFLSCRYNHIKFLDSLAENLEELICDGNNLSLDNLPNLIIKLSCKECTLKSLDNLPPRLKILNCSKNPNLVINI